MKAFSRTVLSLSSVTLTLSLLASAAFAQQSSFEVTITNLTRGQTFTPVFVVSHNPGVALFELGQPAGEGLIALAESGDTGPLEALIELPLVVDVAHSVGLLAPGESTTVTVSANVDSLISVASMLIPTNDSFIALNAATVPAEGSLSVRSPAYDAGSENNDELCANIPGPVCGGEGLSPEADGEGFVHISSGIWGVGDLDAERDWRNPAATIVVRRISN